MSLIDNMQEEKREKKERDRTTGVDIKNDPETWEAFLTIAQKQNKSRTDLIEEFIENTVNPTVDVSSLSLTAKEKVEITIRKAKRELDAAHAMRMKNQDEEVRRLVLEKTNSRLEMLNEMEEKARSDKAYYQKLINNHQAIFTTDEYRTILMCLHPDGQRTSEKLTEAFRLVNSKKVQLTKEK